MFEVGRTRNESTPEFSVYRLTSNVTKNGAFLVEFDGNPLANQHLFETVEAAHKAIKKFCKENIIKQAGVAEVFGRNRLFITTNRYGFSPFKGT